MTADMLHRYMLTMRCRYLKKDMVDSKMKYQETGDSAIRNQVKRTQNTFLHSVKASLFRGFQREATFYYPIWHGQAPRIISTFLESYNFLVKTIVPFCTSHSSGIGSSADNLHDLCSDSTKWEEGKRFEAGTSKEEIEEWLKIFPHSCLFFCFRTVQEKTKRDLCTVDRGRGQQTADKDKGWVEDVVSGLCEQIGHSADGDLVYSVFDPVTVVEMGVHDDVDQVNKVGLCTNIIDDLCSGEKEISGKGQEKADEANRKQKRDGSVPKIKMSVLKAFSE